MKEKLHISERQQNHFYKNISIGVVRTIEYLAKFYFSKNEHLYETYLSNKKDYSENLVELSNNDIVEKDCFFIAHDPKLSNFMKYENTDFGISIQVLSSRTAADILTNEGKMALKDEIKQNINDIMGEDKVIEVYFTEFIIQ